MNEPKRRGRPPKAKEAEVLDDVVAAPEFDRELNRVGVLLALSEAYALRVWAGQSVDVGRDERIARVARALAGQGLSMEGVKLP
jgi:hypothetical protein